VWGVAWEKHSTEASCSRQERTDFKNVGRVASRSLEGEKLGGTPRPRLGKTGGGGTKGFQQCWSASGGDCSVGPYGLSKGGKGPKDREAEVAQSKPLAQKRNDGGLASKNDTLNPGKKIDKK